MPTPDELCALWCLGWQSWQLQVWLGKDIRNPYAWVRMIEVLAMRDGARGYAEWRYDVDCIAA